MILAVALQRSAHLPVHPSDPPGPRLLLRETTYPEGLCMALPRNDPGTATIRGGSFGVICQGKSTGKSCFWDNNRTVNSGINRTPGAVSGVPSRSRPRPAPHRPSSGVTRSRTTTAVCAASVTPGRGLRHRSDGLGPRRTLSRSSPRPVARSHRSGGLVPEHAGAQHNGFLQYMSLLGQRGAFSRDVSSHPWLL